MFIFMEICLRVTSGGDMQAGPHTLNYYGTFLTVTLIVMSTNFVSLTHCGDRKYSFYWVNISFDIAIKSSKVKPVYHTPSLFFIFDLETNRERSFASGAFSTSLKSQFVATQLYRKTSIVLNLLSCHQ